MTDKTDDNFTIISGLPIPKEFICPITQQIMNKPVMAFDKKIYEKDAILNWLKTNQQSPITGEKIDSLDEDIELMFFPQTQLKERIASFRKANNI